jgi:hypothetical protein
MKLWGTAIAFAAAATLCLSGTADARSTPKKKETPCGDFGTSIYLEDTPAAAAKKAKEEEKLVMVLHVSGHFEDPALT